MKKFGKLTTLLLIMLLVIFTACQNTKPVDDPAPSEKVLTLGTPYTIDTLNPYKYSSDGDRYVLSQVMESLVEADGGKYFPLLATSWSNPDEKTWDFKIREDAFWHEGNEVYEIGANVQLKAQDVKDCFDFVLDPANKARRQAELANIIEKVEVIDDFTVRFTTLEPHAYFLQNINRQPIFSLQALEVLGEDNFSFYPIGTGAFKFSEYKPDDKVVLLKNDSYPITPHLDKVIFSIIPDKSVAAIALQTNEIDVAMQLLPTDVQAVRAVEGLTTLSNTSGWYRYVAFNVSNPLFEDKRVREAFSLAVNMDEAVDSIFDIEGLAVRAPGPVPKGLPGYTDAWFDLWEYNVEAAKNLLSEAGWVAGSDGILEKDGVKMSFVLKTPNDTNRSKLGVIVATQLKAIGIDCTPQTQEWATHLEDIRTGNVEMFIMGGGSTIDGLNYMFHSKNAEGGAHNTHYKNSELDNLIEQATRTVDSEAREVIWEQAARIIVEEKVHISAYYEYVQIGINERVVDYNPPNVWVALTSPTRNVNVK